MPCSPVEGFDFSEECTTRVFVVDSMAYSSTLKMEVVRFSETSNFTGVDGVTGHAVA
jgi:hypothetical protein